jgi:hypothetical protein
MTIWESLDPEVQRHWLALAEAKQGMPVTWNDVEPARREGLLETAKAELCQDRWEDETPDRQRWLLARFDKLNEQSTRLEHEALKIIIDDLGVDCTPDDPDWRALFLALMRKYGPASARPRRRPPWGIWKLFALASDFVVERNKPAAEGNGGARSQAAVLRALVKRERWERTLKKGKEQPRTAKSLGDMLGKARKLPPIRDMFDDKTTPQECKELLCAYELLSANIPN